MYVCVCVFCEGFVLKKMMLLQEWHAGWKWWCLSHQSSLIKKVFISLCIEGGRGVEQAASSSSSSSSYSSSDVLGFFVYKILGEADFKKLFMFLRSFLKEHNLHELCCHSFP
jgi:hypothetical protein